MFGKIKKLFDKNKKVAVTATRPEAPPKPAEVKKTDTTTKSWNDTPIHTHTTTNVDNSSSLVNPLTVALAAHYLTSDSSRHNDNSSRRSDDYSPSYSSSDSYSNSDSYSGGDCGGGNGGGCD